MQQDCKKSGIHKIDQQEDTPQVSLVPSKEILAKDRARFSQDGLQTIRERAEQWKNSKEGGVRSDGSVLA